METTKDDSDSDEDIAPTKSKKSKNKALNRQMFGESDEEDDEPSRRKTDHFLGEDAEYESDDMDEFIVDEDDDAREPGRRRRHRPTGSLTMVGPSAYQMDEAEELFGDVEGFLKVTQGATAPSPEKEKEKTSKTKALLGQYEPSVISEHMMTERDEKIRQKDVPERYQLAFEHRTLPSPDERAEESDWICEALFSTTNPEPILPDGSRGRRNRGEVSAAIDNVLRFYHEEKLEPAFVRRYCREFWKYAGLKGVHMTQIMELDGRWDKSDQKRKALRRLLQRSTSEETENELSAAFYEMKIKTATDNQIRDFAEFLALETPEDVSKRITSGLRRPAKRDFYRICHKAKLNRLARKFTLHARRVGGILAQQNDQNVTIPTPDEEPETLALEYIQSTFPEPEDALKGARHMAACELASEPIVRERIRALYRQRALLYTEATVKGQEDIDDFHYCHGFQYLHGQPVAELFNSTALLRLSRAEKEGYVTMTIEYEQPAELLAPLKAIYVGDETSPWYTHRQEIVQDAVYSMLLPSLERELRDELVQKARQLVVKQCGEEMRKRLWIRPYKPRDGAEPLAIGVWVEDGRDAKVYIVAVDENGQVVDKMQSLVSRDEKRIQMLSDAVLTFLSQHEETHVVVLNTNAGMKCMDMGELIDGVRTKLQRSDIERFGNQDGRDYLHVTFVQDDVARIYSRSNRAESEYPDEPEGVRGAVSLARYIQNPLSEQAAMWEMKPLTDPARGSDLLSLTVHPLQHFVGRTALIHEYDRVFSDVVNQVGVDINLASHHQHASYQLQFVAGLGPAKATALIAAINRIGYIERRDDLQKVLRGKKVFRNAIAFLRVRERDTLKESALNPLDDTRIHPESYYMAVKMCGDANNKTALDLYDPDKYSYIVEDTMFQSGAAIRSKGWATDELRRLTDVEIQDPLSELDLPAYASRLEQDQKGLKLMTLEMIKKELRYPYFDKRTRYQDPTDQDMLFVLHGETRETLREGMIVPCKLVSESRDFVRIVLENGIRTSIPKEALPDYMDRDFLRSHNGIPRGMTVHAKILRFEPDNFGRFNVVLGCNDSSLRDMSMNRDPVPTCADIRRIREDSEARIEKLFNRPPIDAEDMVGPRKTKHRKRQISHAQFRNIDCRGVLNILRDQPIGEAFFRPSSHGISHLTLTWKMADRIYRHYDIEERDKATDRRLGAKLMLKGEIYEDLDEILARFIGPMNDLVDDVTQHAKFRSGTKLEIENELKELKEKNPKGFPYLLRFTSEFPGCLVIIYITNKTPRKVCAQFGPQGMTFFGKFSSRPLPTVNDALNCFKKSIVKLMQGTTSSGTDRNSSRYQQDSSSRFSSSSRRR